MTERTDEGEGRKLTRVDRDLLAKGLDEQWDMLVDLAVDLSPEDWERPTDLPGWSVKDNYAHIIGTEAMLLGRAAPEVELPDDLDYVHNDIGRFNETWVRSYRDRSGAEVLSDLAEVVTERRAALSSQDQFAFDEPTWTPAGEDSYGRFMRIRLFDQWFHEQDVREATDRPGHLEGTAPELVLDEVAAVLGYVVGKRAALAEGSSVRLELTGSLARTFDIEVAKRAQVVEALDRAPTVTLSLPGEVFLRISGGRRPWDEPAFRSQFRIAGDSAVAEQVLANLTFTV